MCIVIASIKDLLQRMDQLYFALYCNIAFKYLISFNSRLPAGTDLPAHWRFFQHLGPAGLRGKHVVKWIYLNENWDTASAS